MCENGDGSLFLLSFPFQLCGVCSNIPVPPLSEELLQAEKPNKPPSPSESQTFTRSCRKGHFPLGREEVWPRLQRQVAVSSPAVAASQAPAPPPPPTFLCSGNSGSCGLRLPARTERSRGELRRAAFLALNGGSFSQTRPENGW